MLSYHILTHGLKDAFTTNGLEDADELWKGMQDQMIAFINNHGGNCSKYRGSNEIISRVSWTDVQKFLQGNISFDNTKQI